MALLSAAYVLRQALSIRCLATDALLTSTIVISSWQSKHTSFEITQVKIQGGLQWPDLNYTLILNYSQGHKPATQVLPLDTGVDRPYWNYMRLG